MRIMFLLLAAFIGSLLGGGAVNLFVQAPPKGLALDVILLGAFPVALLTSGLAWKFSGSNTVRKKRRN